MLQTPPGGGLPFLNIAHLSNATRALGPGVRSVVWVQGCPFNCAGCVAQDWIEQKANFFVSPKDLVSLLLMDSKVSGFTFSGGEPMLMAAGLAEVIKQGRKVRDLTLICYTGFKLEDLSHHHNLPGVSDLLAETDVLIDGRYIQDLNDNRGLRGSSNQIVHYLTDRLIGYDFTQKPRKVEVNLTEGSAIVVGVPPKDFPSRLREMISHNH